MLGWFFLNFVSTRKVSRSEDKIISFMKCYSKFLFIIDLMFSECITDTVNSIRLDSVGVPKYAIQGKKAVLECPYELDGQNLYSVKWYKNGREFFR